jgi:hypothetical protein
MPIGGDEGDIVLKQHSLSYPGREVESLHRKFAQRHGVKAPTGDPRCSSPRSEACQAHSVHNQFSC